MAVDMNYGIDFRGGSSIEVQALQGDADVGAVRAALEELNLGEVQVQEFGTPSELLIRIGTQEGGDSAEQSALTKVQVRARIRLRVPAHRGGRPDRLVRTGVGRDDSRAGLACWRCWSISGSASNGSSPWARSSPRFTTWS